MRKCLSACRWGFWPLLLLIGTAITRTAVADCVSASAGLVGWWAGDGNANNVFGTNNGTLQGGVTASGPGLVNTAFTFDGTNGSVSIPNSALLRPTNLTIEAWVKFASLDSAGTGGSPAGDQYLVFRQNTRSGDFEGFDLSKTRVNGVDVFRFLITAASAQKVELRSTSTINTGAWYHLAAVRGSNFVQLYVNGALERQTNISFPQDYGNFPLYFGSSGQAAWDHKLKGSLDEVTLYSRALSSNEIAAVYAAGGAGKCKAPTITSQPRSATLLAGSNVTLTVAATGFGTLFYQWRSNSVPIPGATNPILTLSNAPMSASADYTVVVTNLLGSITSAVATLTVLPVPGAIVNLNVGGGTFGPKLGPAAIGQDAADVWTDVGVGTWSNLKTARGNPTQTSYTGVYSFSNWLGPGYGSGDPMLDDWLYGNGPLSPFTIAGLPSGAYDFYLYSYDSSFQISVGPQIYGPQACYEPLPLSNPPQWQPGRQYVLFRNVAVTNGGAPVAISVNSAGHGDPAMLAGIQIVCNSPWILEQPTNLLAAVSSTFVLQVTAEALPSPSFHWFLNGSPLVEGGRIHGATSNILTVTAAQVSDAGNYYVVVTNTTGASTSLVAAVQVGAAPSFAPQPSNQTNLLGTVGHFSAGVSGDQPMTFQWYFNGAPFADDSRHSSTTNTVLSISGIVETDAGNYFLVASNLFGVRTSAVATLTVLVPATILSQPGNQYVLTNTPARFSVLAKGDQPLTYQWFFGSTPLSDVGRTSGATGPVLTIQNVQFTDLGGYTVVVSNALGAVTSAVATLSFATVRYVNVGNPGPAAPFLTWATAANTIQDAIDASGPGDHIIVTNGTYSVGGTAVNGSTLVNRVAATRPVVIESVNGPAATVIQGVGGPAASAIRSVYLTNGAVLNGFTVKNGGTRNTGNFFLEQVGGGICCESIEAVITNCIITGNLANGLGGGVYRGTLYNCTLNANSAPAKDGEGGGAAFSSLYNCALTGNFATWGGGALNCSLSNCVVSGNTAHDPGGTSKGEGGGAYACNLTNCSIINNSSRVYGGGVSWGTIVGCLVAGNSADNGGGAAALTVINCTIAGNSAVFRGGTGSGYGGGISSGTVINSIIVSNTTGFIGPNYFSGNFTHCCTSPAPGGDGNFDADPLFLNYAGGDYHLLAASPCVNAGTNDGVSTSADLDGQPRIVDGVVDIGSYELQHVPFVITQPLSQSVLIHSNVSFSISALGDGPLFYAWQKDGTSLPSDARISGTAAPTLVISNILGSDAGGYRVVVSNSAGSVTSLVATLTPLGLPVITIQPASRTVPAGTNITFSVTASGLAALSYQWRLAGSEMLAKTNSSLSLTNVQAANTGDYDVVITNLYGSITSSVATLTVQPAAPSITTQAISRVASVGQTVAFNVSAKGTEPLTCQWQFNGSNLPGATGFALVLPNVNSSLSGTYRAVVSNSVGLTFSTNVTLVVSPIIIWGQTNNPQLFVTTAIPPTATNIIAIAASGNTDNALPGIALRADGSFVTWGYSSRDLPPPTNAVDVVAVAVGSSGGSANSLVLRSDGTVVGWSNGKGNSPSTVNGNFVAVAAGGSHQLALRDDGTVVSWGSNTSGLTNVPPDATNIIAIAAGSTHSLALRMDGKVIGWGLNTSGQTNAFTNTSTVYKIAAGGNQSMGLQTDGAVVGRIVTNNGPTAIFYGSPPADATNMIAIAAGSYHSLGLRPDRTVTGWGQTNSGQLNVPAYVTNVLAIAAGGGDSLALVSDPFAPPIPPRIGRPPLSRVLIAGRDAVLNALPIGGLPLRCEWYKDGNLLGGQTNQWLAITNCQFSDAGHYQLVAINAFGSATSSVAVVSVVLPPPAIKSLIKSGQLFSFTFDTFPGVLYIAEFASAPAGAAWTELDRRTGNGSPQTVMDTQSSGQSRFYRLRAFYPPP